MEIIRRRAMYPSAKQKKKLLEMMAKHPELIKCRPNADFGVQDFQRLWLHVANECNNIPGAKKNWRQWKKTWQDMKTKMKKKHGTENLTASMVLLTKAEQEVLGIKNVSSTTASCQESTEFVCLEEELDNVQDHLADEMCSAASLSEPESPEEVKVFAQSQPNLSHTKLSTKIKEHSNSCLFNCDMLALQEQKKLQIKKDYYSFKQDYLRQKLLLMKEQTEALKTIATELAK